MKRQINHWLLYFTFCLGLCSILFAAGERLVRAAGYAPWENSNVNVKVDPGGKFFKKDPLLGYSHIPGEFKVSIGKTYSFHVTHLTNTLRITQPLNLYMNSKSRPGIWIFGCSYVHGWGLNDEETFPYLLQNKLKDFEVVNFGTSGYGTIHAFIQLREALKQRPAPKIAVLVYGSFHDERNTFSRIWRKNLAAWNLLGLLYQPYARVNLSGNLYDGMAAVEYSPPWFVRVSALAAFFEKVWDHLADFFDQSHEVSKKIIQAFNKECLSHNIKLVVAGIVQDKQTDEMLRFCSREKIITAEIAVPLNKENTLYPLDRHPNAFANKFYSEKLYNILQKIR